MMIHPIMLMAITSLSFLALVSIGLMVWALRMVASQTQMNMDYFKTVTALVDELKSERAEQN